MGGNAKAKGKWGDWAWPSAQSTCQFCKIRQIIGETGTLSSSGVSNKLGVFARSLVCIHIAQLCHKLGRVHFSRQEHRRRPMRRPQTDIKAKAWRVPGSRCSKRASASLIASRALHTRGSRQTSRYLKWVSFCVFPVYLWLQANLWAFAQQRPKLLQAKYETVHCTIERVCTSKTQETGLAHFGLYVILVPAGRAGSSDLLMRRLAFCWPWAGSPS